MKGYVADLDDSMKSCLDGAVDGLDSSVKGYVGSAVDGLDSSVKGYVDGAVVGLDSSVNSLKIKCDGVADLINNQSEIIKKSISSQNKVNDNLMKAVTLFNRNYDDCKNYFFNGHEDELKEHFNTDDLFRLGYFNDIKFLSYSPKENRILLKTKEGIVLSSNNRFYTLKEVIGFNGYSIPQLYQFEDFVVFDVGMNRAYASLWFANFENCSGVYGFEIDDYTYEKAIDNIALNRNLSTKIKTYNFGFSDKDEDVTLYYLDGCDGLNTMISDFTDIQYELKNNKDKLKTKVVQVKKASSVLLDIIEKNNIKSNIVLKIDTEGAEYKIINDLIENGVLDFVDIIMGEGHLFSDESIVNELLNLNFKLIKLDEYPFTYDFAFVKEQYFDKWLLREF